MTTVPGLHERRADVVAAVACPAIGCEAARGERCTGYSRDGRLVHPHYARWKAFRAKVPA